MEELCDVGITSIASGSHRVVDLFEKLIHEHFLATKKLARVLVQVQNPHFHTVPKEFAASVSIPDLFELSGVPKTQKILQHRLSDVVFAFSVEQELLRMIEKVFPSSSIRHAGAVCLSLFLSHVAGPHPSLMLNVAADRLEICAARDNHLLFYNNFSISSNEDALYYLLFAMEQFSLDPLTTRVTFAGERSADDELVKSISRYVRSLEFARHPAPFRMEGDLATMPAHYYYSLLNQHLCEL